MKHNYLPLVRVYADKFRTRLAFIDPQRCPDRIQILCLPSSLTTSMSLLIALLNAPSLLLIMSSPLPPRSLSGVDLDPPSSATSNVSGSPTCISTQPSTQQSEGSVASQSSASSPLTNSSIVVVNFPAPVQHPSIRPCLDFPANSFELSFHCPTDPPSFSPSNRSNFASILTYSASAFVLTCAIDHSLINNCLNVINNNYTNNNIILNK